MVLNDGTLALHLIIAGALNANSHFQEQINTQAHRMATMTFKLHEFSTSKDITWQVDMDSGKLEELGYDMIGGWASIYIESLMRTVDLNRQCQR